MGRINAYFDAENLIRLLIFLIAVLTIFECTNSVILGSEDWISIRHAGLDSPPLTGGDYGKGGQVSL
jgi:hypothetical protein